MFTTLRITRLDSARRAGELGYYLGFVADDNDEFREVLEKVKSLPTSARRWVPDAPGGRAWWILAMYISQLYSTFPGLRQRVDELGAGANASQSGHTSSSARYDYRPTEPQIPHAVADAFQQLYVAPSAPVAVVNAAYRALAKMFHPDTGGNTQAMQRLNAAYEVASEWTERQKGR